MSMIFLLFTWATEVVEQLAAVIRLRGAGMTWRNNKQENKVFLSLACLFFVS